VAQCGRSATSLLPPPSDEYYQGGEQAKKDHQLSSGGGQPGRIVRGEHLITIAKAGYLIWTNADYPSPAANGRGARPDQGGCAGS
jgi:hypothetical protein